ncbi:MAG: CoA-binding domain protein [Herbinix sp.]|nr:CoA-binding domain protein [Herbinix sp.]
MIAKTISKQTLQRMPLYLSYLKSLPKDDTVHISATVMANDLKLNDVQVRKDLAQVSDGGRPKIGYIIEDLMKDIEHCLGYDNVDTAILIGAGNLGRALLAYDGFSEYGMDIVTAFDVDETIIGTTMCGKQVLPMDKLPSVCKRMKIKIGIITVDSQEAQNVCDVLVNNEVLAIWNFAPVHLNVPDHVLVQNENMVNSLAILSNHMAERLSIQV